MLKRGRLGAEVRSMSGQRSAPTPTPTAVKHIAVAKIRLEHGLDRRRDRGGHREVCDSIAQFGVLTPITVRVAPDDSGDYLLIKGQGRTLACRLLDVQTIPAVVVTNEVADKEKVQQFLVENVARLRMRPIDRALLIARARQQGEETLEVARRFGVSASTVRRLESQLDGAGLREVAVLRQGKVTLALHAVVAKHVAPSDRGDVLAAIVQHETLRTKEVNALLVALGWRRLTDLGSDHREQRLLLLAWACVTLDSLPTGSTSRRFRQMAAKLPIEFEAAGYLKVVAG